MSGSIESEAERASAPSLQGFSPSRRLIARLAGRWVMERRLTHLPSAHRHFGRLTGEARIEPVEGGAGYHETGRLALGDRRFAAERGYAWRAAGPFELWLHFADGRPFHALDPSRRRQCVRHDCAPDLYLGAYAFDLDAAEPEWRVVWRVTGPAKNYLSETTYRRSAP